LRKIIRGDEVIVITGSDKGKTGVIDKVISDSFIIKGVNLSKKHQKPNPNKGVAGGIVQIELPIHKSNIAIYNKSKKSKDKVLISKDKNGNKIRLYRSSNKKI
jgi:large subunit ribosomal protein L24